MVTNGNLVGCHDEYERLSRHDDLVTNGHESGKRAIPAVPSVRDTTLRELSNSARASADHEGCTVADVMEDLVLEGGPGPAGMVEDPLAGQRVGDTVAMDQWAGASDGPDLTRLAGVGIGLILSLALSAQRLAAGRPWWEVAVFVAYGLPLCCFAFMMVLGKLAGERSDLSRQQSAQAPPEEVLRPAEPIRVQSPSISD